MAYKTFQNGFPLPASDLNNFLMNQSVIVFSNASARSSTLPTPTEGMITYLEDTNALETYDGSAWVNVNDNTNAILKSTVTAAGDLIVGTGNAAVSRLGVGANGSLLLSNGTTPGWLGIGANNTVLTSNGTTATWSTPASAGEVQISSTALSGTSVTLSSIPGTYQHLRLLITGANITGTTDWQPRIRLNSGTLTSVTANKVDVSDGGLFSFMGIIEFYASASNFKILEGTAGYEDDASTNYKVDTGREVILSRNTGAITSITFDNGGLAGTFNAGTIQLWGVR